MPALDPRMFAWRLALTLTAFLAVASDAKAQAATGGGYASRARQATARPITLARPVEGRLSNSDPTFSDGSHFQTWKFSAIAGTDVAIALSSREFGAFLMLVSVAGDSEQPLQMAIADSATKAAQVSVRIPADGDYLIVANTQEARATGRYQLSLRGAADSCAGGGPCAVGSTAGSLTPISRISMTAAPTLAVGASVNGQLTPNDRQLGDSSRFNTWRFDGRAGERIVIDQSSAEFDTYLLLLRQTPTGPSVFRQNDDAPRSGSTRTENSQIAVELPESGPYIIIASSFRPNATGAYQLTLRSMEEACAAGGPCTPSAAPARQTFFGNVAAAPSPAIALGDSVQARLATRDPFIGDGTRFNSYRFSGGADDEIAIFLDARAPDASGFNPYLHLLRAAGDSLGAIKSDDDDGGQRNSLITMRLPASGEYFIVANGLTVADTGNYTLRVMRLADACAWRRVCDVGDNLRNVSPAVALLTVPAERIAIGSTLRGVFDQGSPRLPDGKPFVPLRYTASANERVVITNRSDDFDAYLYVYAIRGDSVVDVTRDDDGAGSLDAQIAMEFSAAGEYLIVGGSFDANARGAYTLTLEAMSVSCAAGGPCEPGATSAFTARLLPALAAEFRDLPARGIVRSELSASASRFPGGSRFQSYRFRGRAGERIVLSMESTAFDAYLHLAMTRGSSLRFVGRDDDGGSGTDARLVATLPESGEYLVVATALGFSDSTGFGPYTISRASCDSACAAYQDLPGTRSAAVFQPALAAERRRVPRSGFVDGRLAANDPTLTDGTRFHAYWIEGQRGATVRAAVHSRELDPFVVLMRVERDRLIMVAADDDGGEGTDALLEWPVDRTGTYMVIVTAFSRDSLGAYALDLEQGPASAGEEFRRTAATTSLRAQLERALAVDSRPLSIGQPLNAEFTSASPELPGRGRFHAYRFTARAQDRVVVTMASTQFDTYLYLVRLDGTAARIVAVDDDGGGGTDSRISANILADGEYLVIAAEFEGANGAQPAAFTIKVEREAVPDLLSNFAVGWYNVPVSLHNFQVSYDHGIQAIRSVISRCTGPSGMRRKSEGP